jgi:MFS family permease
LDKKTFQWPFYYGWMIVALAFLSMGIWLALRSTFSVFLVALLDEFKWSRAATAGIQSVSLLVYTVSAPLVGALIDRVGPRKVVLPGIIVLCIGLGLSGFVRSLTQLYVTYGLVAGFGAAFISIIAYSAVLSHWFERRRGLASGIAVSGMGVGTFTLVPFAQYLIGVVGWRFAYLTLAGLIFLLLFPLAAAFLRYKPEEMGLQADPVRSGSAPKKRAVQVVDRVWAETDWTLRRAAREGRFWAVLAYCFLVIIPLYVVLTHAVGLLTGTGFDKMGAAFIVALLGISSTVFKIFWGWMSDRIGRETAFTMGAVSMAIGVLLLLCIEAGASAWLAYPFVVFFGCGWGVTSPIFMSVAADLFQGRSFGLIYGVNEGVLGIGSALGPWLGGFIFDATGTYRLALLIAAGTALASCPFIWMAAPRKVRRLKRSD